MMAGSSLLREQAISIWKAAVTAVEPGLLLRDALHQPEVAKTLERARRILVVGAGKAGAGMAEAVETAVPDLLNRLRGIVNVPAGMARKLRAITLHAARPDGVNHPTAEGVAGAETMLALAANAQPGDVALCLLSGGGSALLPAPAVGISLADKQEVTRLLHSSGATINEMNCVRKHLSRIKGGRLAQAFSQRGIPLISLIISDVVGDPLDVIASGPTAPDPSTFADALEILGRFEIVERVSPAIRTHLEGGVAGRIPETLKFLPPTVTNRVLGNNARALAAAQRQAEELGFRVLNLGSFLEGETQHVASVLAGIVRSLRINGVPLVPPVCLISGGETTVTLPPNHGKGGRNQEMVLAMANRLGRDGLGNMVLLSAGTDGEDGPTDAAGALADKGTLERAADLGLDPVTFLARHDAYEFFKATGDLLRTGLTGTNVMDIRIFIIPADSIRLV